MWLCKRRSYNRQFGFVLEYEASALIVASRRDHSTRNIVGEETRIVVFSVNNLWYSMLNKTVKKNRTSFKGPL